nr:MAG TPA: hypothetical protein [Caudoviricetes sp.]
MLFINGSYRAGNIPSAPGAIATSVTYPSNTSYPVAFDTRNTSNKEY